MISHRKKYFHPVCGSVREANLNTQYPTIMESTRQSAESLCECKNFSLADLSALLSQEPTLDFESILRRSGAGTSCTACLLNLEYHYTELQKHNDAFRTSFRTSQAKGKKSLKRRVFDFIDGLCPPMRMNLSNLMPVLAGTDIRQSVLVANDANFYGADAVPDDATVELTIRNADGKRMLQRQFRVSPEHPLDFDVSECLAGEPTVSAEIPLSIGSVDVRRWWDRPTVRGTTRPQIIIDGPGGCGGVHTQGSRPRGDTYYSTLYRPTEDRVFISYNNCSNRPVNIRLAYPFLRNTDPHLDVVSLADTIPTFGVRLFEICPPGNLPGLREGDAYDIHCHADGPYKALIFNAPPDLSHFSVDHPANS